MSTLKIQLGLIVCLALFISCGNDRINNETSEIQEIPTIQETPKALQEDNSLKVDIKSYGRESGDLVEVLYSELVENSSQLQTLEKEIDALRIKPIELKEKLNAFNNKSTKYYSSAEYKTADITDSLLQSKMKSIILKSKNQSTIRSSELNTLMKSIDLTGQNLNDHHIVMKIVLTLPLIEKYQKDNISDKKEFKNLILEQSKLIEGMNRITPKY